MAERCCRVVVAASLGSLSEAFAAAKPSSSQKVAAGRWLCRDRRDISPSITRPHALLTTYGQRQATLLDLQPHPPTPGIVQAYFD